MATKTTKAFAETDLYAPIHDYLIAQGYTVRSEVKSCDVAAVKGDELIIIELKRGLSLALLAQAVERQKITDSVYVAIPRPANRGRWMKQSRDVQKVLRRLELGLILVATGKRQTPVEIIFHPAPSDRRKQKRARRAVLHEIENRSADFNRGGSTKCKLVTAYREKAIQIACVLAEHGPLAPRRIRDFGTGDKTRSILYRNVYGWFDRVDRGLYSINNKGLAELKDYPELVESCQSEIASNASRA